MRENAIQRFDVHVLVGGNSVRAARPQLLEGVGRIPGDQHVSVVVIDRDYREVPAV